MKKIAVFASGAGSNAQKLIEYFNHSPFTDIENPKMPAARVSIIITNKPTAGVIKIAENENLPVLIIEKERFFRGDGYVTELKSHETDFIVLAGFLWKIPQTLIEAYPRKIVNIHPALLPGYGGKGMYGSFVHQAVLEAKEIQSGITIHLVDEHYDKGDIVFQAFCPVEPTDTPDTLAQKVHQLEHQHYPKVVEKLIKELS